MKAEETVMGQWTIKTIHGTDFGNEVWKTIRPLLEAQAKITWGIAKQEGRKEVVEEYKRDNPSHYKKYEAYWQAKKKEWGIE